ncbi:Transcriptional corepressor LEUNIG [Quillaja saponaria]|uniref:Transcriptional corepressor LEUNIG n=1 Tax=Quillaja saponaria TaxID=32244 RepID=A0AAD7LES2_QUISA|nr:Transcriptional corepressor LEUNIG [Quillaja saponaria]
MSQINWEADNMLDVYIYDYFMKRKLHASAKAFQAEGKVSTDSVAIDAHGGFLFEWWSVFWGIFISKTNGKHSEAAASYNESQLNKACELQNQQQQELQKPQQHRQMQMQLLLQKQQQQQQRRDGTQLVNGATMNAKAAKMYEESLNLPLQGDALNDSAIKQKACNNAGHLLDPNYGSLIKAVETAGAKPPGQTLLGMPRRIQGKLQQLQNCNQQLPRLKQHDPKSKMNSMIRSGTDIPEGSLIGVHGSNQGLSSLTLKGWPLMAVDQHCSGFMPQKKLMQSPRSLNHHQLQHQLMLQTQKNLAYHSAYDLESRRLGVLFKNPNIGLGGNGQLNSIGTSNHGSPAQFGYSVLPLADSEMRLKGSKTQIGRKRKQAVSSSGPANSSGTANTTGPLPSSPSTTSMHTPGDVMSMPTLQQNVSSSKSLLFGSDALDSLTSADNEMADMDHLVGDGSLDDNVESFFSPYNVDPRDRVSHCPDVSKGFTFKESQLITASSNKVECCDFSSDGKLLATGGHDRKVVLWWTESFVIKATLEEHSQWITDVRFSPSMEHIATSSADKTVRVWDPDHPCYSVRIFTGHATTVMSLDFHPSKEDLIFSCDNNSEIRYWSIRNGGCAGVFKGGATHMRFQPCLGRLLAAAVDNLVSILDVETLVCKLKLQGHKSLVRSVCWDTSGEYLASVSDDLVRVWTVKSGGKGECIHELNSSGHKFNTCVFHPSCNSLLIIGCYETLELWDFSENKTMTVHAHDKLVSALAVSNATGLVASASQDNCVKLWK